MRHTTRVPYPHRIYDPSGRSNRTVPAHPAATHPPAHPPLPIHRGCAHRWRYLRPGSARTTLHQGPFTPSCPSHRPVSSQHRWVPGGGVPTAARPLTSTRPGCLSVAPTVRAASGEARAGSEVASQRTARRMPAAGPLRRGSTVRCADNQPREWPNG